MPRELRFTSPVSADVSGGARLERLVPSPRRVSTRELVRAGGPESPRISAMSEPPATPTELLMAWGRGDGAAFEQLVPLVHAELVDLYQSLGPVTILEACVPAWPSVVGLEAWIAALLGLGVPFRRHPEIPANEQKVWDSHCEQRRQMARQAVHAELCLGAARNAVKPAPRVPLP